MNATIEAEKELGENMCSAWNEPNGVQACIEVAKEYANDHHARKLEEAEKESPDERYKAQWEEIFELRAQLKEAKAEVESIAFNAFFHGMGEQQNNPGQQKGNYIASFRRWFKSQISTPTTDKG